MSQLGPPENFSGSVLKSLNENMSSTELVKVLNQICSSLHNCAEQNKISAQRIDELKTDRLSPANQQTSKVYRENRKNNDPRSEKTSK